jgi:hypothetical protein
MKKLYTYILTLFIVSRIISPVAVFAVDRPKLPDAPTSPTTQEETTQPSEPKQPDTPDNYTPAAEETTTDTTNSDTTATTTDPANTDESSGNTVSDQTVDPSNDQTDAELADSTKSADTTSDIADSTSGDASNQVGDVGIDTGDSDVTATLANDANTNILSDDNVMYGDPGEGVAILNNGNGSDSNNDGSAAVSNDSDTVQINNADVNNKMDASAVSGRNTASRNVGSSSIDTGDSNVTGTIINNINTNAAGVMVSEFNIVDDQTGDYVLNYDDNCTFGCGSGVSVANTDNGSNSQNSGEVNLADDSMTFQSNMGNLNNDMVLVADSGNNEAKNNTGGDNTINTGDANIAANILNFMNNNIAGNVVYGVVNVFGDLIGDIILPQSEIDKHAANVTLANNGNGSGSENDSIASLSQTDQYQQFNDAEIINNIDLEATTGKNEAKDNTGGNNSITTGDSNIDANVTNIANNNVIGDNWWVVFINDSGNWIGKIINPLGVVVGDYIAGSNGTDVSNPSTGVYNVGNGSDSSNLGEVNKTENTDITQVNQGKIVNNVDLTANTGRNTTSRNTNGDNSITTGDANIQLNVMNFMNNNVIGGNVFVTFINVFGKWEGDFLAPGANKQKQEVANVQNEVANANNNSNNNSENNNNTNNNDSNNDSNSSSSNDNSTTASSNTNIAAPVLVASANSLLKTSSVKAETPESTTGSVLGDSTVNNDSAKKVTINLAWGLLALPIGFGIYKFGLVSRLAILFKRG